MPLCILFVLLISFCIRAGRHSGVPTYLNRRHSDGTLVDRWGAYFHVDSHLGRSNSSKVFYENSHLQTVQMKASPSVITQVGNVTLTWSGVDKPGGDSGTDWIGIYCPPANDDHSYLDWVYASGASTYAQGHGSLVFTLTDTRFSCNFRYFTHKGESAYEKLGTSNDISFVSTSPMYGHLALTGDPTEMHVSFVTNTKATPQVNYGLSPKSLTMNAQGTTQTYQGSDMCGPPATTTGFIPPGQLHAVLLTGLTPKTKYYYSYGIQGHNFSNVKSFTTAPKVNPDYSFKFVVYGDMGIGGGVGAQTTADQAAKEIAEGAELVVHTGDISYARGAAYIWDRWFGMVEPFASQVPYMVTIGNHEYDHTSGGENDPSGAPGTGFHPSWGNFGDDSSGECAVPVYHRFTMPKNGNAVFWYSFDYGSVHNVMVSSEHDCSPGSDQYKWLVKDLASVDRSKTPWIILTGHRPMYNSEQYASDYKVAQNMQKMYEDVLHKYQVDLAYWGHYHAYERTCPVYKEECTAWGNGTTHITIGSAGASLDTVALYGKKWSLYFDDDFGIGVITIANKTALHWEYIRNKERKVIDERWIYKKGYGKIKTEKGCTCKQPWGPEGGYDTFYRCQNPTGDVGNWCYVEEEGCGQTGKGGAFDYCDHTPMKTQQGCTCLVPYTYKGLKYYGCSMTPDEDYSWCYVSGECGTKGSGGYWDKC